MRRLAVLFLVAAWPVRAADEAPRIVFLTQRADSEYSSLAVMRADGTQVRELVPAAKDVMHAACSPAGSRLAYVCDPSRIENFELRILEVDTGKETSIHHGIRWFPAWSPDGKRLAFMRHGGGWRIHFTNPDLVVDRPPQEEIGGDGAPNWSPDGRRVVFQTNRDGNLELYLVDAKTGRLQRLTDTKEAETLPVYSPDGKWIAYIRAQDIWIIRSDGSVSLNLTDRDGKDGQFEWSPDSTRLAFVSQRNGNDEVLTIDPKTRKVVNLSKHKANDRSPAWSPDGKRILFVSDRDGNEEIYVMNADGTGVRRLTRDPARNYAPAWLKA